MRYVKAILLMILAHAPSALAQSAMNTEARSDKVFYFGTRLTLLTGPGDVTGGYDVGLYLRPDLIVTASYQKTLFSHVGYCASSSAGSRTFSASAQYFIGGFVYVSAGV